MTREEAIKFLTSTKVYVKDKSREIQAKLFSLGFRWNLKYQKICHTDKPFLFMYRDGAEFFITYSTDVELFNHHPAMEITPEDILNITTEPKYRPFKDADECWNEMLKHKPFGRTKHIEKQFYENWVCAGSNGIDSISFNDAYKDFTFADGTPFGIKED